MSKENIIKTLNEQKLVTQADIDKLRTQTSDTGFFRTLLEIYENKVMAYVSSCKRRVKKNLISNKACTEENSEALTIQKIIDCAYSVLFEENKAFLLASLCLLLKNENPELAVSLGMSNEYKNSNEYFHLEQQALHVFVKFIARYELFNQTDHNDLHGLCTTVNRNDSGYFPEYLFQSLLIQKSLDNYIKNLYAENSAQTLSSLASNTLTASVKQNPTLIYQSLQGIIFYLCKLFQAENLEGRLRDSFFAHLDDDNKILNFANAICGGYLQKMEQENRFSEFFTENAAVIKSEINLICMPAMCLFGVNISDNANDIALKQNELNRALETIQHSKNLIEQAASERKHEVNKKIDEDLSNFKSQWTIGFGTGVGMPGVNLRF